MKTLSEAIKEAYASVPSHVIILHTLEISHPDFERPIRVVRNFVDEVTWLKNPDAAEVLDAMPVEEKNMVGLVARLEAGAGG